MRSIWRREAVVTDSDLAAHSLAELQALMTAGEVTAVDIVHALIARIEANDRRGPAIRAILQINPEVEEIAASLDRERRAGHVCGPLHGIPILLKDNIDTADLMETTAGSLALLGSRPVCDAFVAEQLRAAGAVVLGKCNMSEWANFRSRQSSSGWSARGGQALNPYVLDRSPCGSSSGSATAVAAGFAPASLGTETSGSILCPAAFNSVVGVKPTVGLTSRAGVIPVAHSQDTVGPLARTVADAAAVLSAIAGADPRDAATSASPRARLDYRRFLVVDGLRGARLGIPRGPFFGFSSEADAVVQVAIDRMREHGAEIIDPVEVPSLPALQESHAMIEILLHEFKAGLQSYLAGRPSATIRSLADLIRFNRENSGEEMPYFGQDLFESAEEKGPLTDSDYLEALAISRRLSRQEGLDAVLDGLRLDALVAPTAGPPFVIDLVHGDAHGGGSAQLPAMAGYPAISVPAGYDGELPIGVTFIGRAFTEPTLIRLAHAFEQTARITHPPQFLPTV